MSWRAAEPQSALLETRSKGGLIHLSPHSQSTQSHGIHGCGRDARACMEGKWSLVSTKRAGGEGTRGRITVLKRCIRLHTIYTTTTTVATKYHSCSIIISSSSSNTHSSSGGHARLCARLRYLFFRPELREKRFSDHLPQQQQQHLVLQPEVRR